MAAARADNGYVLGRGTAETVRLDAQHLLFRLHNGYNVHPKIPIRSGMKIAEVGTGTGIWLFDLAQELPSEVCLDGYDISDAQFPSKELWPSNVNFTLMDSFRDPPDSLLESYDVVHLRMWAISVAQGKDLNTLIRSASKLLKPGGYLQWDEGDILGQEVRGSVAKAFESKMDELWKATGIDFSWCSRLKSSFESSDLDLIEYTERGFKPGLIHMCTNTYLLALKAILEGIKREPAWQNIDLIPICESLLDQLVTSRDGSVYNWGPVALLAQKPLSS